MSAASPTSPRGPLRNAQPKKWVGPTLSGKGGADVAMEEFHLVAEQSTSMTPERDDHRPSPRRPRCVPGPAASDDTTLRPVALDDAGFAGVAARGPVDVPVPVHSWPEYLACFGLGPGLLPLAVSAFFAQGGRRAHALRVGLPVSAEAHALIEQGTSDAIGGWVRCAPPGTRTRRCPCAGWLVTRAPGRTR